MSRALTAALAAVLAAGILAASASASGQLTTGFFDNSLYTSGDPQERAAAFDSTVDEQARVVRLDFVWSKVATAEPADPANPADPAYDFAALDDAVRDAAARGLRVVITFYGVPAFAEGDDRPSNLKYPNTWKPDPDALGAFARAVATRYSGGYEGLPAVHDFEAWNEPNLNSFLSPQYEGGKAIAPDVYRSMVNSVAGAVRAVDPANRVIVGSASPYGDDPGGERTRPVRFLRELLCLNGKLRATSCPVKTDLDILSHHPINLSGPPTQSAVSPDDASSADLDRIVEVLRAAEHRGTIASGGRHPLWVTEFWWPIGAAGPGTAAPNPRVHGLWVEQSLYLFWKAGAKVAINFELRDKADTPAGAERHTGVLTPSGQRKPAYTAMRFPFVVAPRSAHGASAWGRAPASGKLAIQSRKDGRWVAIKRLRVRAGKVFHPRLAGPAKGRFRARVAGEKSLVWKTKPAKPTH